MPQNGGDSCRHLQPVKEFSGVESINFDDFLEIKNNGMEDQLVPVCHRCAKLFELFKKRHETIIFLSQVPTGMMRALKIKPRKNWDRTAITKLVKMYKDGPSRSSKIVDKLEIMEKHATIRKVRTRDFSIIDKKTQSSALRDSIQIEKRRIIEFDQLVNKMSANKKQQNHISQEEYQMLVDGPERAKKEYRLYGLPEPVPPETKQTMYARNQPDDLIVGCDASESQVRATTQQEMTEKKIYRESNGPPEFSEEFLTSNKKSRDSNGELEIFE